MSQTLGLTGYAGSGKDTAAQCLLDIGWERRAFADPLRAGLLGVNPIIPEGEHGSIRLSQLINGDEYHVGIGWDRAKREYPEVRRLQQTYGTEGGRHVHGIDCWLRAARATLLPGYDYVFTDVRFSNEVDFLHQMGGVVLRIDRPGVEAVNAHVSDDISGLHVDFVIINDGTIEELHKRILDLVG